MEQQLSEFEICAELEGRMYERFLFDSRTGDWRFFADGIWQVSNEQAREAAKTIFSGHKFANTLPQSSQALDGALRLLADCGGMYQSGGWDETPDLRTRGGWLDVVEGQWHPDDPGDSRPNCYHTVSTPHDPDFDRPPECWLRFLSEVLDESKREQLHRIAGRLLVPENPERAIFWMADEGGGKSLLFDALCYVLGGYACEIEPSALLRPASMEYHEVRKLETARLVVVGDPIEKHWNLPRIRALIDSTPISACPPGRTPYEFRPVCKLILLGRTNDRWHGDLGHAIRRPTHHIEFLYQPFDAFGASLRDDLRDESPAILAWMIEGLRKELDSAS